MTYFLVMQVTGNEQFFKVGLSRHTNENEQKHASAFTSALPHDNVRFQSCFYHFCTVTYYASNLKKFVHHLRKNIGFKYFQKGSAKI